MVWLDLRTTLTMAAAPAPVFLDYGNGRVPTVTGSTRLPRTAELDRLAAIDALHTHERLLREGWVYLVGRAVIDGEPRRVCVPVIARPVRLSRQLGAYGVAPVGDLEVVPPIANPALAARLERDAEFGGGALVGGASPRLLDRLPKLTRWIRAVAKAAGLDATRVVAWNETPAQHRDADGLVAVVGAGLHLARDVSRPGLAGLLRDWARTPGVARTAFGRLYADRAAPAAAPAGDASRPEQTVASPLPLTATQAEVVRRARREHVVAVSGAPGNGKSHTVAAIAIDAVAHGRSVLIATPSRYAADVVGELLHRKPGPDPVLFGSTASRPDLAAGLADGAAGVARGQLRVDTAAHDRAAARVADLRDAVTELLAQEADAARLPAVEAQLPSLRRTVPGLFAADATLDDTPALLDTVEGRTSGVVDTVRRWLAALRLRQLTGTRGDMDPMRLRRALDVARCVRAAAILAADGGTRIGALWDELFAAEQVAAEQLGVLLSRQVAAARTADRRRSRAVTALAAALRSGRATRREQLQRLDADALVAALPLWVGAVTDVEDLLPPVPGMFDLLILDEASQIDQPRAAPALLRARCCVVVGDPRQLRHVSFVADADQRRALADHGLDTATEQLDVRRISAFDAAAAVSPVTFLDEHHRSVPHLIRFSAARFYGDRVLVRTRHPATDGLDAITVERVDGASQGGVVRAEVTRVAEVLDGLAAAGMTSIGVVSPFRAQADALEAMVLDRFDIDAIERLGLRTGTAHAFQGAERDVVVVSLGLTDEDPDQRRRFVEDPHLFNVLVTRARRRMIVVTALRDAGAGLLAGYLRHADHPTRAHEVPDDPPATGWPRRLAAELRRQGATVQEGYRVGAHRVDVVLGDGERARAIECRVHPDGPAAHLELRRLLHRTGWDVVEAWPSRHDDDPVRAALDLLADPG